MLRNGGGAAAVVVATVIGVLAACAPPQAVDRGSPLVDGGNGYIDPERGRPDAGPPPPRCGDGTVDPDEACDLGPANDADGYGPGRCSTMCRQASCGDGKVNGPEECDDGPANTTSDDVYGKPGQCNRGCKKITRSCGDGAVTHDELCDAGMANSDTAYGPEACTTACKPGAFCGDGKPHAEEECDEGAANTADDKTWSRAGGGCNQRCKKITRYCGDGTPDMPDEECDAGMMNTADEMSYGAGPGCNKACKTIAYCGDGNRDPFEFCDEGSKNTKDDKVWGLKMGGCNRRCMVLTLYCGDGHVAVPDEACDAGPGRNTGAPGGCDARCQTVPP